MVTIGRGEVWWAELPEPAGSGPGFRRPVVVVQGDSLNRSRLGTVVCVPLTSNVRWVDAPGGVLLPGRATGLARPSVANATQILSIDRSLLVSQSGRIPPRYLNQVLHGIDVVLGR